MRNRIKMTNGDSARWTNDEDDFLRSFSDLPLVELQSSLNKVLRSDRSYDAVRKRRTRLRRADVRHAVLNETPSVQLRVGGVTISGKLTNSMAKQIYKNIVFSADFSTGV